MQPQTCENCRYWVPENDDAPEGDCRRYPPQVAAQPKTYDRADVSAVTWFPVTSHMTRCGEWVESWRAPTP